MDLLSRLDRFSSYEKSADARDLSQLSSIRRLLEDLGRPDQGYRIVHVVGTCGKGLTAAMIAAILESAGQRTGLYTSPYVRDAREGVQVGGAWLAEDDYVRLADTVLGVAEGYSGKVPLSRFDLMTAIAFLAFSEAGVDWAVVEAGLGGRFDSTNVTDKSLVVLTPIDYDHTRVLGDSLAAIAEHKLGVLRPGTPVVVAQQDPALAQVIERRFKAEDRHFVRSRQLGIRPVGARRHHQPEYCELRWPDGTVHTLRLPARFPFLAHVDCWRTALVAASALSPADESPETRRARATAALGVSLPGRLSYLENVAWRGGSTPVRRAVLDGCHSPASIRACVRQLDAWGLRGYSLVLGLSSDKLSRRLHGPLTDLCRGAREVLLTPFDSPRSAAPEALASFLGEIEAAPKPRLRAERNLESAMLRASRSPGRPLVVAGSLYLIRDVLPGLVAA